MPVLNWNYYAYMIPYWEKGTNVLGKSGNPGYSPMNVFIISMENYTFSERWDLPLSKNT